ncbi:MAG: hypothetical protein Q9168_000832 [Polycauliona sp. 1 TL-2023]
MPSEPASLSLYPGNGQEVPRIDKRHAFGSAILAQVASLVLAAGKIIHSAKLTHESPPATGVTPKEREHLQMKDGCQRMYQLLVDCGGWKGPALELTPHGHPLIHDILDSVGSLDEDEKIPWQYYESTTEELREKFIEEERRTKERKQTPDTPNSDTGAFHTPSFDNSARTSSSYGTPASGEACMPRDGLGQEPFPFNFPMEHLNNSPGLAQQTSTTSYMPSGAKRESSMMASSTWTPDISPSFARHSSPTSYIHSNPAATNVLMPQYMLPPWSSQQGYYDPSLGYEPAFFSGEPSVFDMDGVEPNYPQGRS